MEIKYYYTLNDLYSGNGSWADLGNSWWVTLTGGVYRNELWNYIKNNWGDDYIFILKLDIAPYEEIPERPTVADLRDKYLTEVQTFIKKIGYWLDSTGFRFEKLIPLFKEQENNLLNKLESVTTSQYNDTPQTTTVGLDDDKYASNYTKSTTSTDTETILSRLNEVRTYYHSLYAEWANTFKERFVL